jgi:hypothetical protein
MRLPAPIVAVIALVAMLASTWVLAPPSTAANRWSRLVVSSDGKTWSPSLTTAIFESGTVLAPGSRKTRSFYVRNQSQDTALLTVRLSLVGDHNGLLAQEMFRLGVKRHGQHFHRVGPASTGLKLVPITIRPGAVLPVSIRVQLLNKARNKTMDKQMAFTVELRLEQRRKGG